MLSVPPTVTVAVRESGRTGDVWRYCDDYCVVSGFVAVPVVVTDYGASGKRR